MDKYSTVLQILAIILICFILYLLYRFLISIKRQNRLKNFSLNLNKQHYGEKKAMNIIYKFSDILSSMVIFNSLAQTYERYTYQEKDLKRGMDYISIKIILGFALIFTYLFVAFLHKNTLSSLAISICFILGFIIPDFYCIYLESKNKQLVNKDMLASIIIMNNSYKANRSTEESISEVIRRTEGPVKIEFSKVLNDIRLGLSISDAFKRMYERTNINIVLRISQVLSLTGKSSTNLIDIFEDIETKLLEEEKLENEIKLIDNTNKLSLLVFSILPLIFIVYLISFNDIYLNLVLSRRGIIVILAIAILYILYIIILWKIVKGVKKND